MNLRGIAHAAACLAALWAWGTASAGTITHTNLPDFQTGISDGIVQAMQEPTIDTPTGAVGLMPGLGASLVNDDLNYTTAASAGANWLFLLPHQDEHAELAASPSELIASGDTPVTPEATVPAAGVLRLHASRNQDFFNTGVAGQRSPVLLINKTVLTGDWVAETKFTIAQPRDGNDRRVDGLYIGVPAPGDTTTATDVPLDNDTRYVLSGVGRDARYLGFSRARVYPNVNGFPVNVNTPAFTGQTWWVRIVKRGAYFTSYLKNAENAPWIFHQYVKNPDLAAAPGLVVGFVAISWGGTDPVNAKQYQDDDVDYLRVNRIGALSGSFTNVFDAGAPANWQTVALNTGIKEGLKYQLRAGNTLTAGTLTDAGPFVGPDGTAASFFTDDAAQVAPNATGKRYLEYKILIDAVTPPSATDTIVPANLAAIMRSISATFHPSGLETKLFSAAADFGADAGGVQVQPGGGDLSLQRTQVFMDDFNANDLDSEWTFDPGYTLLDPSVVGEYTTTERPGYLRLKVGYPQDYFDGTIKLGGVKALRNLPAGVDIDHFEIETEVNLENQQSRFANLMMWMGPNDFMGVGINRRFADTYDIGVAEDDVLNNVAFVPLAYNYGSNTVQLRVTKLGTIITLSFRDPNSASPSWRVLAYRDTKGMATGGVDFVPVQAGFLAKSYDLADEATVNYDYNYLKISNLTATGQKDLDITLPAGSHPDSLQVFGDAVTTTDVRAQVKNAGGTYVGPDGTASTFFTTNEPKFPASIDGVTNTGIRLFLGATPNSPAPYIHAASMQYATGTNRVFRDTNAADFAAGTVKNGVDTTTIPGVVTPTVSKGTPVVENFTGTPADWLFSNTPPGTSTYSFTENPGFARVNATSPSDTWAPGTAVEKPRIVLYKNTPISGDFELETYITFPSGRDTDRNQGLAVIAPRAGTPPDANLDMTNIICFGPYRTDSVRMLHGDNNAFGDAGPAGYTDNSYYLRLRKQGNLFTGLVSTDGVNYTEAITYTMSHDMPTVYVGFFAKAWFASSGTQPIDYDYFSVTPLGTTGIFESRVFDLGSTALTPMMDTLGGNSTAVGIQFRAASTEAGLTSLPYVGPDGTASSFYAGNYSGILPGVSGRYVQYKATIPAGTTLSDVAVVGSSAVTVPLTRTDAATALRIAGGLQTATSSDMTRLDVVKGTSAGRIGVEDAASILRSVNGL